MGVCHAEKGGKGIPGKETAYGKTEFEGVAYSKLVRSSLWLKRRGHVGVEKRRRWQGLLRETGKALIMMNVVPQKTPGVMQW